MPEPIDEQDLIGTWVHAHEEDGEGKTVYRPSDWPLPRSRGRSTIVLRAAGKAEVIFPGPTDRSQRREGTWSLNDRTLELQLPGRAEVWELDTVHPDRLVVRVTHRED